MCETRVRMRLRKVRLGGWLLLLTLVAGAQDAQVATKFAVYTWPAQGIVAGNTKVKALPRLYFRDDNGVQSMKLARGRTSPYYRYRGTNPLELFRIEEQTDPDTGETTQRYILYARVTFPAGREFMTVLLFPDRRDPAGLTHAVGLDFHPEKAPKGKATIYNGSRQTVQFIVKEQAYSLAPGQRTILNRSQVEQRRMQGRSLFQLKIAARDHKGQWRSVYGGNHFLNSEAPCLFVIMEYGKRRLQVQQISSLPQPIDDD